MKEKTEDSQIGRLNSINVSVQLKLRIARKKKKKKHEWEQVLPAITIYNKVVICNQMSSKLHNLYQEKFQIDQKFKVKMETIKKNQFII